MKVNTKKLEQNLKKVDKLVGSNKNMEICNYVELLLNENSLIISSTDMTNFITTVMEVEEADKEKFNEVVEGEKLINLVKSTTTDLVEFTQKDSHVLMKGNGKYKLECLKQDFPEYEVNPVNNVEVNKNDIMKILNSHKDVIAEDLTVPELTGYKISDNVITLDGIIMAISNIELIDTEEDLLIPNYFMKLLELFNDYDEETVKLYIDEDSLLFENSSLSIFGGKLHGIDSFPDLTMFTSAEYENYVQVPKGRIEKALKRIKLFAKEENDYATIFEYGNKGLIIKDDNEKAEEKITKLETRGNGSFKCEINVESIITFISNMNSDKVKLMYDKGKDAIKITADDANTDYYSALIEEG